MDQILQTIGNAFSSIFDSPIVQLGLKAIAIYFVVLWLAASYWAFRDLQLRTENPIAPYLAASFIIVFTPIFFPLALYVYRIIRPQEKIGEVYERNLAEEALLAEVEAVKSCPTCSRRINDEWIICPTCRTRLNRVCPNCGKLVGLDWSLCAWCGKDFERRDLTSVSRGVLPAREAIRDRGATSERAALPERAVTSERAEEPTALPGAAAFRLAPHPATARSAGSPRGARASQAPGPASDTIAER